MRCWGELEKAFEEMAGLDGLGGLEDVGEGGKADSAQHPHCAWCSC